MYSAETNIHAPRRNARVVVVVLDLAQVWRTRRRARPELQSFFARQQGRIEATP